MSRAQESPSQPRLAAADHAGAWQRLPLEQENVFTEPEKDPVDTETTESSQSRSPGLPDN